MILREDINIKFEYLAWCNHFTNEPLAVPIVDNIHQLSHILEGAVADVVRSAVTIDDADYREDIFLLCSMSYYDRIDETHSRVFIHLYDVKHPDCGSSYYYVFERGVSDDDLEHPFDQVKSVLFRHKSILSVEIAKMIKCVFYNIDEKGSDN